MKLSNVIRAARSGTFRTQTTGYLRGVHHRLSRHPAGVRVEAALGRATGRKATLERIEMHVTDHCNLNCKGCSHFSSVSPDRFADVAEVERDFVRLAELFARIHVIRLMGGEPLLHPRLAEIIRAVRRSFPDSQVMLVTNGLLLTRQPESFWELLAAEGIELSISAYPVRIDREAVRELCDRHSLVCGYTEPISDFMRMPLVAAGDRVPAEMFELCRRDWDCPFLYHGAVYPCAKIAMSWVLSERFGCDFPVSERDRISIHDARDGYDVLRFLTHAVGWCRFCAYDRCSEHEWTTTAKDVGEWVCEPAGSCAVPRRTPAPEQGRTSEGQCV